MTFTFLHTADWQIGKAFGGMPKDVAVALAEARLAAIDRLADAASAAGARHVLVAGDAFDSQTLSAKTVRQALARLGRHSGLTWHIIPGNHDAHRPGGLWERLLADDPPANFRAYLTAQAAEIERGVWLLSAPLFGRATGSDPTAHFDALATPAGALRIGLAHGSVRGFGSDGEAAVAIAAGRAASARLDYLALGDWHGVTRIDPRTWYSGTPEPDRFAANEPGHALIVRIGAAGAVPDVETIRTARFSWLRHELVFRQSEDFAQLDAAISATAARLSDVLLRLDISGRATAAQRREISRSIIGLEAALKHLDVDVSRLAVRAEGAGLELLGAVGQLRQVGDSLARMAGDPSAPQAAVAGDALTLLLDLVAETAGGRP